MANKALNVVTALNQAARRDDFGLLRRSAKDKLKQADAELKALIVYWRTGKRPSRLPEGEPLWGAIPFLCAHPDKFPVPLPPLLKTALRTLVGLRIVPTPTVTVSDWSALMKAIGQERAITQDGSIYGTKRYEQLDNWWIASLINCFTTIIWGKFGTKPRVANIADSVSIGIIGDWGTDFSAKYQGRNPAQKVINSLVKKKPDLIVHLGDTYYSGTPGVFDFLPPKEEQTKLVACWPRRRKAGTSYTLNSNHEMYSLGRGYFAALGTGNFKHQNATSYFLLQNKNWQVFGLDSAYGASREDLFMGGALNKQQLSWMKRVRDVKRRSIVLCHHNPLGVYGNGCNALWSQVEQGLKGREPDYWYWGHIHNGIVYKGIGRKPAARNATGARCVGHSAIPFGFAWGMTKPKTLLASRPGALPTAFQPIDTIEYFAHEQVGKGPYVKNGFAILRLSGAGVREAFYDEDGVMTWSHLG